MNEDELERQQRLYWNKMLDLRTAADYIRLYRDYAGRWVTAIATLRAVASSTSIAGWAIWHQYAFIWGCIIAVSQIVDALRDVFPMTKRHRAASEYAIALEALFIAAQLEWENILTGRYDADEVLRRLHALRSAHHTAESKSFADGQPRHRRLFGEAEQETATFIWKTYGVKSGERGRLNG